MGKPAKVRVSSTAKRARAEARRRIEHAVEVLKALVGQFPDAKDDVWRRGQHLTLLARLFIMLLDSDLSAAELKILSAIIRDRWPVEPSCAARKRASPPRGKRKADPADGEVPDGRDPSERLEQVVRRLYGVDLGPKGGPLERSGSAQVVQGNENHRDQGG